MFSLMSSAALAAVPCEPLAGRLVSVQGEVEVQSTDEQSWRRAELNGPLCREDTIRVGARSRAAVALENDVVLRIDQNTTIRLLGVEDDEQESSLIDMIFGALQSFSRKPRKLAVNTPYLNATIEGTEFALRVDAAETQLAVFEGQVAAANEFGRILVASGAAAAAQAGRAPEPRT
ncbi:MAG: FecR family protein, partial [Rhodospirillales bacterium]|nr:FecR family protein [Rhodospirillales bacterium]